MQKTKASNDSVVEQMFLSGAHYGYSKTRRHPSVSKYIYATKNKSDIINLEKTEGLLSEAVAFVKTLGGQNKTILFVGTKPEAKTVVREAAAQLDMPYVTERWIGGTLTNWLEIKKRIAELEGYQKDVAEGKLEKYTKKERLVISRKMEKLAKYYSGLLGLKKTPDALFVVDSRSEHIAVDEARQSGMPIVALANSDSNIENIDYPIVANDSTIPSIKFFTTTISQAYADGKMSVTQK